MNLAARFDMNMLLHFDNAKIRNQSKISETYRMLELDHIQIIYL
jgi:hypothetical protein